MAGMPMGNMAMPAAQAPARSMQGMDMAGYAAPAAQPATANPAGSQYYCPMHPNVVSAGPATCPYCLMALKKR
jgi:Cu+-exporting ATPase